MLQHRAIAESAHVLNIKTSLHNQHYQACLCKALVRTVDKRMVHSGSELRKPNTSLTVSQVKYWKSFMLIQRFSLCFSFPQNRTRGCNIYAYICNMSFSSVPISPSHGKSSLIIFLDFISRWSLKRLVLARLLSFVTYPMDYNWHCWGFSCWFFLSKLSLSAYWFCLVINALYEYRFLAYPNTSWEALEGEGGAPLMCF